MKNSILLLGLTILTFTAPAQVAPIAVGSYPGDPSGEQIGHQLFVKLNYDLAYLQNQLTNLQAAVAALQAQGTPAGMVQSSSTISLLDSNPFVFSGSNYLGSFTNIFSLTTWSGTNALTNLMSLDAGASWLAYAPTNPIAPVIVTNSFTNQFVFSTNYIVTVGGTNYTLSQLGTNFMAVTNIYTNLISAPVELVVLSGASSTGLVQVAALADPTLQGRFYDFPGQTLHLSQVDTNAAFIAALQAQLALLTNGITTNIQFTDTALLTPTTNTLYFTNGVLKAVTSP